MPKILEKQNLLGELAAVKQILEARDAEDDPIGRLAYEQLKQELEEQLSSLESTPETLAQVALLFSGDPVFGSRSIDAGFATSVLNKYQELVARVHADEIEEKGLPDHGKIPYRDLSALQITDVMHGSFGFMLAERNADQTSMFETQMKQTLDHATSLIDSFCAPKDEDYVELIETINPRVFLSIKDFFKILHDGRAAVRMVEGDRDELLDHEKVERAFERSQKTTITDLEEDLQGVLLGILPTSMQFEFKPDGRESIYGKTGPRISKDYLERIESDEQTVGSHCVAKILTRTAVRPTGQVSKKYTLLDLSIP